MNRGDPRLLQMLVRAAGNSKPAVVGDVDDPARPQADTFLGGAQFAGEDNFIADERQRVWRSWYGDAAMPVAGEKSAALLGQRLQANALEEFLERQILPEWNEVHLIVDGANRALVIDDINRIVHAGLRRIVGIGEPHRACEQQSVLRQPARDLCECICLARQKEWKRRFRPDQMRDLIKTLPCRQRQITVHHLMPGGIVEAHVLLQVGLHDPQMHAVDEPGWGLGEADGAKAAERGKREHGQCYRQQRAPLFGILIEQRRWTRSDSDGDEGQSPQAKHRRRLR